jgi:hypothetical protein
MKETIYKVLDDINKKQEKTVKENMGSLASLDS